MPYPTINVLPAAPKPRKLQIQRRTYPVLNPVTYFRG